MAEFTFLEIHLDDASIEGSADGVVAFPFSSVTLDDRDDESADSESDGSLASLRSVVLLAILAIVVAVLVHKRRSE